MEELTPPKDMNELRSPEELPHIDKGQDNPQDNPNLVNPNQEQISVKLPDGFEVSMYSRKNSIKELLNMATIIIDKYKSDVKNGKGSMFE